MSFTFPPMNNQRAVSITRATGSTLVTLTSFSTITTTTISSESCMVSINPAQAISVAATEQDVHFETRLLAMENAIFKLGSSLEKLISANNSLGKSQGENHV